MIGNFVLEALGEGAFLGVLKRAWEWAIKLFGLLGVGEAVKTEITKRLIDPKGWGDEYYFALDLAEAKIPVAKKKMIADAIVLVEQADEANGTTYARNFRVVVTFHDEAQPSSPATPGTPAVPATPAVAAKPGTPAKPATPGKPAVLGTPATFRPGIIILEDLAKTCSDKSEVFARIMAVGIMQDASTNLEKFLVFGKTVILPFLQEKGEEIYNYVDGALTQMETAAKGRLERFEDRPWWKKILCN